MSPNTLNNQPNNYLDYNNRFENNGQNHLDNNLRVQKPAPTLRIRHGKGRFGFRRAMKIISLLVVLTVLFRETRHQFLTPSLPLYLATEDLIEPENPDGSPANSQTQQKQKQPDGLPATAPVPKDPGAPSPTPGDPVQKPSLHENSQDVKSAESQPAQTLPPTTTTNDGDIKPLVQPLSPVVIPSETLNPDGSANGAGNKIKSETSPVLNNANSEEKVPETKPGVIVTVTDSEAEANVSKLEEVAKEKSREEEEPIPSYMEWAQKKQLELITNSAGQNGQSGTIPSANAGNNGQSSNQGPSNGNRNASQMPPSSGGTSIDANLKNFASPDCGAKVVQSNSGSTNPSGVLSSSHDEYMLNKCGIPIWFVVELCEPLTIEKVSLGNLELFSSSPKEFELGISDRYPTREWVKLGPFTLPDSRAIHPIGLPSTNSSTFGKFLKVSILSHHGSEHYCPLSVIRVNGKSEYEVLESETTHQEDTDNEENSLHEEQLDDQPRIKTNEKSVVGRAKDTVLNIVNAVKAFSGSSSAFLKSELDGTYLRSRCQSVTQCVPNSPIREEIYSLLSCNASNLLSFLSSHSHWCGWDYCHSIFHRTSIGLPWQPEGFYASLFGGPAVLHAVCHFNQPLKDGCDPVLVSNDSIPDSGSSLSDMGGDHYINDSLNPALSANPVLNMTKDEGSPDLAEPPSQQESEPQAIPPKSASESGSTEPSQEQQVEPPQSPPAPGFVIHETQIPAPSPTPEDSGQSIPQQIQGIGGSQQKESTFVRLANRIKTLERNQSLTASYLEELSRRFKKQNEDNSILNESNKKVQNDTRAKLLQVDEYYRQELQSLRRNVDDVRERLFTVQLQRSLLVIVCFSQTLFIVGGCVWVKRRLRDIQYQSNTQASSNSHSHAIPSASVKNSPVHEKLKPRPESGRYVVGRKRSNSDVTPGSITDKAKKIKKKKRNNGNGGDPRPHLGSNPLLPSPKGNVSYNFSSTPKENIDPHRAPISGSNTNPHSARPPSLLPLSLNPSSPSNGPSSAPVQGFGGRPTSLLTKVDSPFVFNSPLAPSSGGSYLDSGVCTSSRFALLASPGPESPVRFMGLRDIKDFKEGGIKRTGSGSSAASSSMNSNSTSDNSNRGMGVILNGHSSSSESAPLGKNKGKKVGLKAFMPKIFDRGNNV